MKRIDQFTSQGSEKADSRIPITWENRLELRLLRCEAEVLIKAQNQ